MAGRTLRVLLAYATKSRFFAQQKPQGPDLDRRWKKD